MIAICQRFILHLYLILFGKFLRFEACIRWFQVYQIYQKIHSAKNSSRNYLNQRKVQDIIPSRLPLIRWHQHYRQEMKCSPSQQAFFNHLTFV